MKSLRGIHQHPKSQNWVARFRGAEGRWVNRSTGTPDAKEAERIAAQWKLEAEREREKKASDASHAGIADTIARAQKLARQGRMDPHAAREIVNDLIVASGGQAHDAVTNTSWCETWRTAKARVVSARTKWKYDQVAREWLAFLGRKAEAPMETVTRTNAVEYRDGMAEQGLAAPTVNSALKILRSLYGEAVEQGIISRNPFLGIDRVREEVEDAKRIPFTAPEVLALVACAQGDWKGVVLLAASTGLRLGDVVGLTWSKLDLERDEIRLRTAKTGKYVELAIHPEFRKWLMTQHRGIGAARVFSELEGMVGPGRNGLSLSFGRLMARAGIDAGVAREGDGRGRTTSRKSFHSLRHFAASQLAAAGVRADVAMAITGHSDSSTHANYVNVGSEVLREAVHSIPLSALRPEKAVRQVTKSSKIA